MKHIPRILWIIVQWSVCAVVKAALLLPNALGVLLSVAGDGWKRTPPMWKWCADAVATPSRWRSRWGVFYYWAIRNPVKMMAVRQPSIYAEWGWIDESLPGFQWRYRRSEWLDSFRVAWGEPRAHKGKREFYIGWKLSTETPEAKFTIQLRPF